MAVDTAALEQRIATLKAGIGEEDRRLRSLARLATTVREQTRAQIQSQIDSNLAAMHSVQLGEASAWDSLWWSAWRPGPASHPERLRWGSLLDAADGAALGVPAFVPLVGSGRSIVIVSSGEEQARQANALLQALVVRTSVMFPQQSRYTLLDPSGNGMAFPMARYLARVEPSSGDVRRDLDAVTFEIQRIIQTYLDAGTPSFEQIPDELRMGEAYHFVFAAEFPKAYDLRAAEAIQSVARTGPAAGTYVILHHNLDHEAPGDLARFAIEAPVVIDMTDLDDQVSGLSARVSPDGPPEPHVQESILTRIKNAPPTDRPVAWSEVVGLDPEAWWQESAVDRISTPIGRHGANQELTVWFGMHERDGRACAHGVLGAMTGAGKSTLFHNLITGLAIRYSPQELRLYLIDGKFGVEFQPYRDLPHSAVVSLRTSPELSRSVLSELIAEMSRRNETFVRCGVADLAGYRRAGSPEGELPRLLLVIDEFQDLFVGDRDGEASKEMLRLSQQGRSAGVHMLLASQRFDAAEMLHRTDIFGNLHLRLAMQMAQADIASLTDFGPTGRRLIDATCNRPGRVVLNDHAGDDGANVAGKVALLEKADRDSLVSELARRAAHLPGLARPIVFNGDRQPDLVDSPSLMALVDRDAWLPELDLEVLARNPVEKGGLGIDDWLAAERPVPVVLGQAFSVRGQAALALRRRSNEHLVIFGERHTERVAMLAAAMLTASAALPPSSLQIRVVDRSHDRTSWSQVLSSTVDHLSEVGFEARIERDEQECEELLRSVASEVERRRAMPEAARHDQPTLLLVLNEPERISALQRNSDEFGYTDSELGQILRGVIAQGPAVGVHLVMGFPSLGVATSVIAERVVLNEIRHRVAMQMSEDDAFVVVRSNQASKLQVAGERPIAALLFDNQQQRSIKFKPYSIERPLDATEDTASFDQQVEAVTSSLARRSAT